MADDVQLEAAVNPGDIAAADEIPAASGIKYQRVKLIHGIDGVNDGDVAASNPFPVKLAAGDAGILVLDADLAAIFARLTNGSQHTVVDNFPVTQPVSAAALPLPAGAATAAAQTDGTQKAIMRAGAKGATAAADTTSTASGADHQPHDVILYDAAGNAIDPRLIRAIASGTDSITVPGVSTEATLALIKAKTDNLDVALSTRTKPADSQLVGAPVATPVAVRLSDGAAFIAALPVTDNNSSLTVDAPVGTPVFSRLSDGAAALIGQEVMASSLPVAIASDQSSIPVAATLSAETVKVIGAVNQGTSPWVIAGGKTNNNAAPGATNAGILSALANAGIQAWTEGNQVMCSVNLEGSLRTSGRPMVVLGGYQVQAMTGVYTALGAGAILFSARWGDATRLCLPLHLLVFMNTTTAATVAGMHDRDLVVVRGFTASETGGTAITLTGNNQKMRTSQGTSLFTDMRIAAAAALTIGTGTADAQAIGLTGKQGVATEPVGLTLPPVDLYKCNAEETYPLVFAQNEGLRVRIPTAMPTTVAQRASIRFRWLELAAGAY